MKKNVKITIIHVSIWLMLSASALWFADEIVNNLYPGYSNETLFINTMIFLWSLFFMLALVSLIINLTKRKSVKIVLRHFIVWLLLSLLCIPGIFFVNDKIWGFEGIKYINSQLIIGLSTILIVTIISMNFQLFKNKKLKNNL